MTPKEKNILKGPPILYEPSKGGLGFEIFKALEANKGKIAQYIIETGEVDTYDDLLERSVKTAIFLRKKNLRKEDLICLCSGNHLNSLVPFVASQFIGTIYASIEPTLPEDDILYFLDFLQPKILFTTDEFAEKLVKCVGKSNIDCEIVNFSKFPQMFENVQIDDFRPVFIENLMETAIIFLSSGTTGKPKGICNSHYSLLAHTFTGFHYCVSKGTITFNNFTLKYDEKQCLKVLSFSPMYWISGVKNCLNAFFSGSSRIIGASYTAEKAWKAIEKYQPEFVFLPPGQANELCFYAQKKKINECIEIFITGGVLVTESHLENIKRTFPNAKVLQAYGQTENCGLITTFDLKKEEEIELQAKNPNSCGKVVSGIQLKVVDLESEENCSAGQHGEIRLKNKFIMNGYYKMDSSSAFDSRGWFKTGDLGFFDENGCVFIVDRIKDMLFYTLYNIRPSVIENILYQHPAVLECFVFGYPHPNDNEHPMGVVLLKENYKNKIDGKEIEKFVNDRVPSDRYKIRAGVKIVDEMLTTPSGKLRKIEMKQRIIAGTLQ